MNPSLFPPIPSWDAAHPIVVHLPIGILASVPVLAVWAMLAGANRRTVGWAVLILVLMGAGGTVLAASSGEAGLAKAEVPGEADRLLARHEDLGELARNCFLVVAGVYGAITILAMAMKDKLKRWVWIALHAVWILGLLASLVVLANAGHAGGLLVHEHGVTATLGEK